MTLNIWNKIILLALISLTACKSSNSLSNEDISILYDNNGYTWKNEMYIFNENDSISNLYVKIKPEDLLFTKTENQYRANYSIKYELFDDFESEEILDSSVINHSLIQNSKQQKEKWDTIPIKALKGKNYILFVQLQDNNRKNRSYRLIHIKKKNENSSSYFQLRQKHKDTIRFAHSLISDSILFVNRFKRDTSFPKYPHILEENEQKELAPYTIDSISIDGKGDFILTANPEEFYLIQTDTISSTGYNYSNISDNSISSFRQLLEPLYYLTNDFELKKIKLAENPKKEFEKFWIKQTGTRERARTTIKKYYKEVERANELFSNNKPGWKTDRGMIYIIYGAPRIVYRTNDSEVWVYGEENNMLSEVFKFNKIENRFNENTFQLDRNSNYKSSWNRMVDAWKEGRLY